MFELVGVQKVDFKDDKGERIQGIKIHFLIDPDDAQSKNGFTGKIATSKFFPGGSNIPNALSCGKFYEFIMSYTGGAHPKLIGFKEVKA